MTIQELSTRLRIPEKWLLSLFTIESGNNTAAQNKATKATGLIQFMPQTANELGTTIEQLKQMSYDEQLWYVYLHLRRYKHIINSFTDLYLSVFFPAAIKENNDYVLQTRFITKERIAKLNPGFDLNKDLQITKGEIETYLKKRFHDCYIL